MAQKSQNVKHSDENTHSHSSTPRDGHTTTTSRYPAGSSGSSALVLPRMSDPTPISGSKSASPQPMAKSTSSGSNPLSKDAAGVGTASPYGTRSRNRTGASRPNYAEDKDVDTDFFELYPERREDEAKKSTRQATSSSSVTQDGPPPRSVNGSSRKPPPPPTEDGRLSNAQHSITREQQHSAPTPPPPTTNGGSGGPAPSSKKRKATSQTSQTNAGNSQSQPAAPNAQPAPLQRRTAAAAMRQGPGFAETNVLSFDNCGARPKNGRMVADDGTVLEVNDNVYLVCEPPGEPYYLGRIMEFLHVGGDNTKAVDYLRINWFYRPKEISRKAQDTRLVFATMHSDTCPLSSLRGKCQIKHRSEIPDLAEYKRSPDCFWFEKLYDRYIQKIYEVIPTSQIVNVPEHVKRVLDERWKFILAESGRAKELTSAAKVCKRCSGYCASNDSVDCAVCQNTYHMNCVRPPLLKKPSRGFAWSCAACSRAQEKKLEARNTPNVLESNGDVEDEEYVDDEEEEVAGLDTGRTSPDGEEGARRPPPTAEQVYHASLWPYRYLGMHCTPKDALDYDDRIYPRASSRLGPRHQATVLEWPGRPVKYVPPPPEIKKSNRKDGKLPKDVQAAIEADRIAREKRPKWIQDEPKGFVRRGEDFDNDDPRNTAQVLWKPPEEVGAKVSFEAIDEYMDQASSKAMAASLELPERSTNLRDVARDVLFKNAYDFDKSLKELPKLDRAVFREPELTPAEVKEFEKGVAKFGSELISVKKHVRTVSSADIVRLYYTWKKTERGKQIWGNFSSRKGKKEARRAEANASKLQDDVADDHDDSAFDTEKAAEKKRAFICKFCSTKTSRQWRRAPNASNVLVSENGGKNPGKDKGNQYVVALCRRCAELWRRYAIQWEDIEEVAKKVAQTGGRSWRRRVDEELVKELLAADQMMSNIVYSTPDPTLVLAPSDPQDPAVEPPRKKLKGLPEPEQNGTDLSDVSGGAQWKKKEKVVEKPAPPPAPEMPKPRALPCAVCHQMEPRGDQHLSCRECRMTVHRNCYGIVDNRGPGKWICDMCLNDKNPQLSIHYKCVLCPIEYTEHDFVEPPKISHKKKTEKERERERVERENAQKAAEFFRKRQEDMNKPVNPREPLKRTADNNWVHVTCAVWTPEVKFGNARALGPSEGIPSIARARYGEVCKACKQTGGACVACHQCRAPVHVECANQGGFLLGFDITPVKSSRRDQFNIVTINGETGTMSAAIWCKEHVPTKTIVHRMQDVVDENGLNALQLYVQNFKQADLTLTGCARKADQITLASKMSVSIAPYNRRASTTTLPSPSSPAAHQDEEPGNAWQPGGKICLTCGTDVSPKWYQIDEQQERRLINGYHGVLGAEARKFVDQRTFQCHKCKKANRQPPTHQRPREPSPAPEPVPEQVADPTPHAASPSRASRSALPWTPPMQAASLPVSHAPAVVPPPPPPPTLVPPPAVAPPLVVPVVPVQPQQASLPAQPPAVSPPPLPHSIANLASHPPPALPPSPQHYIDPYREWSRPTTQHRPPPPIHGQSQVSGAPPVAPNPIPPALGLQNHLRPPPLVSQVHNRPAPPPVQNGHRGQPSLVHPPLVPPPRGQPPPMVNGVQTSPKRTSGPPPLPNGVPYAHPYPPSVSNSPPHRLVNGVPPSRPSDHHYNNPAPPRAPFTSHGNAPPGRDPSSPTNPTPPRENRPRPSGGASSNPSLRNLLL